MMNSRTDNEYKAAARLRKAHLLVSAIRAAGGTVAMIDELGDKYPWAVAAEAAGVHMPSDDTKALVREALEFIEQRSAQPADPFEGLV